MSRSMTCTSTTCCQRDCTSGVRRIRPPSTRLRTCAFTTSKPSVCFLYSSFLSNGIFTNHVFFFCSLVSAECCASGPKAYRQASSVMAARSPTTSWHCLQSIGKTPSKPSKTTRYSSLRGMATSPFTTTYSSSLPTPSSA